MTNTNSLTQVCYCQSARHARAVVKALEAAGFAARADSDGRVYSSGPADAAFAVAREVKAVR